MISIGILNIRLHDATKFKSHFTNQIILTDSIRHTITFRIREILKSSVYNEKYVVDVLEIDAKKVSGKSLLNVQKDSTKQQLKVDTIFTSIIQFNELYSPLNPYQFDYTDYLKKQNIYHQLFSSNNELLEVSKHKHTIYGYAARLRENIQLKLKEYNFSSDEYAIISALLLGQRQDISKEIYESYSQAGAIHILAVSGLHIGIVLLLLNYLLKPLEYLNRGKYLKIVVIVILLWCFAIVAGLSASVTRAVTMFTIIAIAMHLKRPSNIYNTLAISAFILLLFKPIFLFDVGFQLSYLAVFSIVTIQPKLYQLWKPKWFLTDKFWQLFTVSVAAQLGVLPVSLFYFHQFPGLFMLSNLVIIPFIGIILMLGILVIALSLFQVLPSFLADLYLFIISLMNQFVSWISIQESFLIKDISFSFLFLMMSYGCLIFGFSYFERKTYKSVVALLLMIILFQGSIFYEKQQTETRHEFVIFNKSRQTIITENNNGNLKIYHDLDSVSIKNLGLIRDYKVGRKAKEIQFKNKLSSSYQFKKDIIILVDSLGVYQFGNKLNPIILLIQSPKINLERLIENIQPKQIIADASNYKSQIVNWKFICDQKGIPFYYTAEKGAIIFK